MTPISAMRIISERHYQRGVSIGFLQGFLFGCGLAAGIYWAFWRG